MGHQCYFCASLGPLPKFAGGNTWVGSIGKSTVGSEDKDSDESVEKSLEKG